MRNPITCTLLVVSLALSGCNTLPTNTGSSTSPSTTKLYAESCFEFGAPGAVLGGVVAWWYGKKNTQNSKNQTKKILTGAAGGFVAGCVIGFAKTAVGRIYDERAQKKAEEAAQRDAARRAKEMTTYAQTKSKLEAQPVKTAAQQKKRDADLERARAEFERSINTPVVETVGSNSTIEIRTTVPAVVPDMNQPGACIETTQLGDSPSGKARQVVTQCRDDQGNMVATAVQEQPI